MSDSEYDSDGGGYYDDGDDVSETATSEELQPEEWSVDRLNEFIAAEVERHSTQLHLSSHITKLLLFLTSWTPSHSEVENCRLLDVNSLSASSQLCTICYCPSEDTPSHRTPGCGHYFCTLCWTHYIRCKVSEYQFPLFELPCMEQGCPARVLEDVVRAVCKDPEVLSQYRRVLLLQLAARHPDIRFCPGPDCAAVFHYTPPPVVSKARCSSCKTTFCPSCVGEYHAPTSCDQLKAWERKCRDESETSRYLKLYTKDCPKCDTTIEKSSGCNHLTCRQCKHEFCWVCLGNWSGHGAQFYACNKFKPNLEGDLNSERAALKRYLFYLQRYENHRLSLLQEKIQRETLEDRVTQLLQQDPLASIIDYQYLMRACDQLLRCRHTLKFTYPYAYYCEPGVRLELFQNLQAELEVNVEMISEKLVDNDAAPPTAAETERLIAVAERRREALLNEFRQESPGARRSPTAPQLTDSTYL